MLLVQRKDIEDNGTLPKMVFKTKGLNEITQGKHVNRKENGVQDQSLELFNI